MTGVDVFNRRWHAVVNDLIGGWSVSTVDQPLSANRDWETEVVIADCLSEEIARYVTDLHNRRYEELVAAPACDAVTPTGIGNGHGELTSNPANIILTKKLAHLLHALVDAPHGQIYAYGIATRADMTARGVALRLKQFTGFGWLERRTVRWAAGPCDRHYYTITPLGERAINDLMKRMSAGWQREHLAEPLRNPTPGRRS